MEWSRARFFGIGHSTRPLEELVGLLWQNGVATLADIRTLPGSRRVPWFNGEELARALEEAGIRYVHLKELGGLRKVRKGDPTNDGWRNASFRAFADHMQSGEFARGLEILRALAADGPVALMCAEAVPWRCHRSLVSDALVIRGADVRQIIGTHAPAPHRLTRFAHVEGFRVTYPVSAGDQPATTGAHPTGIAGTDAQHSGAP